jgi:hypothetical protein
MIIEEEMNSKIVSNNYWIRGCAAMTPGTHG